MVCRTTRSESVATVTVDKNDVAKLLGLREVGVPRITHDSGARLIHSKLFYECSLNFTCCSVVRAVTVADAGCTVSRRGRRSCYKCAMGARLLRVWAVLEKPFFGALVIVGVERG